IAVPEIVDFVHDDQIVVPVWGSIKIVFAQFIHRKDLHGLFRETESSEVAYPLILNKKVRWSNQKNASIFSRIFFCNLTRNIALSKPNRACIDHSSVIVDHSPALLIV